MLTISKQYMQSALSLVGVTALSLVLAFIAMELVLQHSSILAKIAPEQFLFSEAPQHFRDQHNEFGYSPFSYNREVAIYSDRGNAWVEYDASFTVNNAGLVQRKDIDPTKPHVVVVGDSFTHGQGASPWFYELENELPGLPLANLGFIGTGAQHWEKAVDWFQERIAGVDMVVVIFIASDFLRAYWFAKSSPNEIQFCYEVRCSTIFTKLLDKPPFALAQHRRELLQRQGSSPESNSDSSKAGFRGLLMKTQTGTILVALSRKMRTSPPKYLEANKRSLQALRARHYVAFALHLPEKGEASEGAWSAASLEIKDFISAMKLPYVDGLERCGLNAADFRKFDPHPNPVGYRKIQKCVGALLKTTPPRTSSLRP